MNVVFISPHFPLYFHNFCSRLKQRNVNVLGIIDTDYQNISQETKNSLTDLCVFVNEKTKPLPDNSIGSAIQTVTLPVFPPQDFPYTTDNTVPSRQSVDRGNLAQ